MNGSTLLFNSLGIRRRVGLSVFQFFSLISRPACILYFTLTDKCGGFRCAIGVMLELRGYLAMCSFCFFFSLLCRCTWVLGFGGFLCAVRGALPRCGIRGGQ